MTRGWLLVALACAAPAAARDALGTFARWGAFRDTAPRRCFAIAEPVTVNARPSGGAFVSIASWPAARAWGQLHVRLSRARHSRAAVTLAVGERRFTLAGGARDAWAADAAADRAIVAAIRAGRSLSVETLAEDRRPFADVYALAGAPTAIDAALLGCA